MLTGLRRIFVGIAAAVVAFPATAQQTYQRPPRGTVELLDAPAPPAPFVSPAGNALILATPVQYRPISDLAEPAIRGAGVRINPRNNGHHLFVYYLALKLQRLPDGPQIELALPAGARVSAPRWNASGSMFAFTNSTATAVELWVGDTAKATVRPIEGIRVNPARSVTEESAVLPVSAPSSRPPGS